MQISSRRSARRFLRLAALTILSGSAANAAGQAPETTGQEAVVARRAYFVGTSEEVRSKVKAQAAGHQPDRGNDREIADYDRAPPACGVRLHQAFAGYCVRELKVALAPCISGEDHALCSTDYLTPRTEKVYWRLQYHRVSDQASLELVAVRRGEMGRPVPSIVAEGEKFEELFDLLQRTSRCEAPGP